MTLTDLSEEMNRRDCLAELDRVLTIRRGDEFFSKWGEPLRQLLIDLTTDQAEIDAAYKEANEIEKKYDDLRATAQKVIDGFDDLIETDHSMPNKAFCAVSDLFSNLENAL